MITRRLILIGWVLLGTAGAVPAQDAKGRPPAAADTLVGQWAGNWDGAGEGKIDLTIKKGDTGKLTGRVAVTGDNGSYSAEFTAVTFDGRKLTIKYDFPMMAQTEITLEAAVDGGEVKGSWSLRPKGQDAALAAGSWNGTKKKATGPSVGLPKSP